MFGHFITLCMKRLKNPTSRYIRANLTKFESIDVEMIQKLTGKTQTQVVYSCFVTAFRSKSSLIIKTIPDILKEQLDQIIAILPFLNSFHQSQEVDSVLPSKGNC